MDGFRFQHGRSKIVYTNVIRSAKAVALFVLSCAVAPFSAENIVNFSAPTSVGAFLAAGDTLWAASSGGLVAHNLGSGANRLVSDAKIFPDPRLTALCRDRRGNLWAGSGKGYLYRMTPRGQWSVYSNYKVAGWGILCLYAHDGFIVVGSDKGVSLFDPDKGNAVRNAVRIGDFSDPRVNAVTVFGDTLFLGCEEGVACLGGLGARPLGQRNFYDPGIWKTRHGDPVLYFADTGGALLPGAEPAAMFRGRLFTVNDSGWIVSGDRRLAKVTAPPGRILSLYSEGDRRLWIGTDDRYYFSYDVESSPVLHIMGNGFSLRRGARVAVAGNGNVWVTPAAAPVSWHQGIYMYDGRNWRLYNSEVYATYGWIEGSAEGIAFGRDGTAWVGTFGGNVKHIDPVKNKVGLLVLGDRDFKNVVYCTDGPPIDRWGRVDAVAMDSTGYLWTSAYDNYSGSLFCYDPRNIPKYTESDPVKANYRWFFDDSLRTKNITELCVDAGNRIFAYDGQNDRLTVFGHGGNPLAGGIRIDTSYARFGAVAAIRSAPDGATYIAGAGGLMKIPGGSLNVERVGGDVQGLSSIAVQGNVLWLGSYTSGVMRYDLDSGEKRWIGEADGLPSENVIDIAVDDRRGRLWILTDGMVSRLDIGRGEKVSAGEPVHVFPNVFSISGSNQGARHVTFARLEPRSSVSVYTSSGALVAKVNAEWFTGSEWRAAWTPKRNLVPGTYIAAIKPSGKRVKIILKP